MEKPSASCRLSAAAGRTILGRAAEGGLGEQKGDGPVSEPGLQSHLYHLSRGNTALKMFRTDQRSPTSSDAAPSSSTRRRAVMAAVIVITVFRMNGEICRKRGIM
ncbi:hypothetical protein F7725_025729 [Dissostichus mawsoni]|uniref:Uncharacterized protein n=1 Tax=Dissostichus mawsoni TaxID=36200 RepID=A0A7J5X525_DISMA|nr:hypothetical protein F7725_025729 [Dissostichus mawsoni]